MFRFNSVWCLQAHRFRCESPDDLLRCLYCTCNHAVLMGGNKGLKIVHLNIRSICKHRNEVETTFGEYDIICLTESWLNCNVENSVIDIPGFTIYRQDRKSETHQVKKRGGGILAYVKLKWSPYITEYPNMNTVSTDLEAIWLLLDPPKQSRLLIGIVYRPPDGNSSAAIDHIDNSLFSFGDIEVTSEITILGDFNIDYKKSTSAECKYLKELERNHQLKAVHYRSNSYNK